MKKHHTINEEDIKRFSPDFKEGLSDEVVSSRIEQGLTNVAKSPTNKSYGRIIFDNVFTFFNILMFSVAAILIIFVGQTAITSLLFIVIILCNLLIGIIQECKSKHTIEKLKLLADSKNKVIRSGKEVEVHPSEIVLDDVVALYPGDQIPVDGELLSDSIIEINESLLTGESVPVKKSRGDMVYAGSFIVSGVNYVKSDKIANHTYIQSIEMKAKAHKQPESRLMIAIKRFIKNMAIFAIPLAVIVFINSFLHNVHSGLPVYPSFWGEKSVFSDAIYDSGTTLSYMIPSGMALLASIAMATGVVKLGKSNTLAQSLYSVELLSRIDTLCLDKTGTLTDGTMSVENYLLLDKKVSDEELKKLVSSYNSAFDFENQTSRAMVNYFGKEKHFDVLSTVQFSSARKYSAVEFENEGWYVLGAPEYITDDKEILRHVNDYAQNGLRVVALAKSDKEIKDDKPLPKGVTLIAMFVIRDTIRPEVYNTMRWFKENDVDIKVISGDNIGTVSYIAKQSGIDNWDKVVDMSKLTPEDDLEHLVLHNSIFGRVSPDQKAEIIAILKKNGRITGVTGDGLNDLLAFKQADCSIALANGAAATKNVANLVLLDSNFANMKEAVFQGRRVINNVQRSSSLFIMKDFLWMFITIMPIVMGINRFVEPTVMSIVNIFITGIASLFIALEPDKTRSDGNLFRKVEKTAATSGAVLFVPVLLVTIYFLISQIAKTGTYDLSLVHTVFENGEVTYLGWVPVISICITISGMIIFFFSCRPFTKFRMILYVSTVAVVVLVLYLMPEFFIINGRTLTSVEAIGGFKNLVPYVMTHFGANARFELYSKFTLEQGLFILGYALLSYPLYLGVSKGFGIMIEKLFYRYKKPRD